MRILRDVVRLYCDIKVNDITFTSKNFETELSFKTDLNGYYSNDTLLDQVLQIMNICIPL